MMIWTNIKLWLIGLFTAAMGLLAFYAKLMHDSAEKAKEKAKQKTKEAEDATELANQQSALSKAQHDAREKTNEELKKAGETTGTGRDFSRDRMHDHRNKDDIR